MVLLFLPCQSASISNYLDGRKWRRCVFVSFHTLLSFSFLDDVVLLGDLESSLVFLSVLFPIPFWSYPLSAHLLFEGEASALQPPLPAVQSLFRRLVPGVQTLPDGHSQGPSWKTLRKPGQRVGGIGQPDLGIPMEGGRDIICIKQFVLT